MATRAIVTSHPVVACDVCGRSLLRGESPDIFLAGGQRRTVCELCVPRAASGGWLREADNHAVSIRPTRSRRTGSLLGRLRQLREPARPLRRDGAAANASAAEGETVELPEEGLYDFLDRGSNEHVEPEQRDLYAGLAEAEELPVGEWSAEAAVGGAALSVTDPEPGQLSSTRAGHGFGGAPTSGELKVARALEVFNAGEQPRRVAGVARSLGAPSVTVRPLEESGSKVAIIVAWELCWYRYQVDLGDEAAGSQLVGQGMELEELPAEDMLANATADERGELAPLPS